MNARVEPKQTAGRDRPAVHTHLGEAVEAGPDAPLPRRRGRSRLLPTLRGALGNPLGRRVIAWIMLSSCVLALASAVVQLYAVYNREVTEIEGRLDALEHTSLAGLAFAVWNLDQPQIEAQLSGLRALPDVSYVAVHDPRGHSIVAAGTPPKDAIVRRFPIVVDERADKGAGGSRLVIGQLTVAARLDGVYARVRNEAFDVLTGQAAETLLGTIVMLLIFRGLVSRPLADLARAAGNADVDRLGTPITLERRPHAPDDFDTLVQAMNRMRASLEHEVEALQSARDALSVSEHRYRCLVESTNVVAWEMEVESGRLTFIGPQIHQLLGHDRQAWREAGFSTSTVDELDLPGLQAALAAQSDRLEVECRLIATDGRRRWFAIFGERRRDGMEDPGSHWHGHLIDIDARKRSEFALARARAELEIRVAERTAELSEKVAEVERQREEQTRLFRDLEAARQQAMQSDKLASIGQLAAGVAHEINNPIGFVLSNFSSLQRYVEDLFRVLSAYEALEPLVPADAPQLAKLANARTDADIDYVKGDVTQLLDQSRDGLDRVRRIVQDLKDFAHAGEAIWQPADLVQGLERTLNVVRNEIKYKAEVVKRYAPLPDVRCAPSQLNQVFMNLLVNAAHAIADKGTITVSSGVEADEVWIAIADTGCGMPPDVLGHIFDPFFTTKPVGQGTGLGLSVSYSIVKRHGGRIEVESAQGKGSTFKVWLPIHGEEMVAEEAG